MMFKSLTLATAIVATLAAGCATHQETGMLVGGVAGAAIAGPVGGVAAAHIAAGAAGLVVGAIIGGEIGKHMDEQDQKMAAMAVTTNETKTWTNSSSSTTYVVTPKDNGNGTSTVTTEATKDGKTVSETTTVKKPIKE